MVITQSQDFARSCEKTLKSKKRRTRTQLVPEVAEDELRPELRKVIDSAVGIKDGSIDVEAVIVDGSFKCGDGSELDVTQPLYEDLPDGASSLLDMLLGAGIPVLVNGDGLPSRVAYEVGRGGARLLAPRAAIRKQVLDAIASVPFNRATLEVENEFANEYDSEELGGAATVSAILSENEFVVSELRTLVKEETTRLKILDLGCGTGRFEEILLTDPQLRPHIERIVAVDFAPRYLVKARRRLSHFLPASELEKVTFLRRVVEDLHFPDDYFDVVLASFGVVCFSRSHLTLQETSRVVKKNGLAVFNGYNRSALTYEFDEKVARTADPITHFAIHIDKQKNKMQLGTQFIDCMTFDIDAFENLLRLVGLRPRKDRSRTFPTFYGAARRRYLTELPRVAEAQSANGGKSHGDCHKPGSRCHEFLSYQDANLQHYTDSGFNGLIHKMDADLEQVLEHRGFYFAVAAYKGS